MKDKQCLKCPLRDRNFVAPEGPISARVVIIGEAPGQNEDIEGKPFVGGAGNVLNMILSRVGIKREEIYITNVLKCRPPKNNIKSREASLALNYCKDKLLNELRQLKHVKVIVPMGNTALSALGYNWKIGNVRGHIFNSDTFGKIIPTYHPAYIMRQWQELYTVVKDWTKIKNHVMGLTTYPGKPYDNINPDIIDVEMFASNVEARTRSLGPSEYLDVALDLETYYIQGSATTTAIKLVGLAVVDTRAIVIPIIKQNGDFYWETKEEELRAYMAIGKVLENSKVRLVIHNALFDVLVLMNHGFTVNASIYDTEIAQYLLYHPSAHSLNYVASIYADTNPWKEQENERSDEAYRKYNAHDTRILLSILKNLDIDVTDNGLRFLFDNILMKNITTTCQIMINGLYVDQKRLNEVEKLLEDGIQREEQRLRNLSGISYLNPNSGDQIADVLFNTFKLKSQAKTKSKKKLSVDAGVLKKLLSRYANDESKQVAMSFLESLMEYRKLAKQKSTYIDKLRKYTQVDGRVHTNLKMHTVVTGRYASSEPNILNLPARADSDGYIRSIFSAPPGKVILELDYSQEELYIYAVIAQDAAWVDAYYSGKDVHKMNMVDMIGYYDDKYRTFIKNFIYGLIYGSQGSEIERAAPKELMDKISIRDMLSNLEDAHPSLFMYRKSITEQVTKSCRVRNVFNRTRWYPTKASQADLRSAINFPIQSTAADIIHMVSPKIQEALEPEEGDKLILQLYDAFYLEVAESRASKIAKRAKSIMEEPVYSPSGYEFKLKVDVKIGRSMGKKDMKDLEV